MKLNNNITIIISGIILSLGLLFSGFFIYKGLKSFSEKDRFVSVKGLSEEIVNADYAILKIKYIEGDNDMQSLLKKIETNNQKVVSFFKQNGILDNEITIGIPSITDKLNNEYGGSVDLNKTMRYYASVTIALQSNKVKEVRKIEVSQFDLIKQGVTISKNQYYDDVNKGVEYSFTKLNDIKPKMIELSTKNARIAAEQFAKDSKSRLGGIKSATQGQFEIIPSEDPLKLKVRVVSAVSFYLD